MARDPMLQTHRALGDTRQSGNLTLQLGGEGFVRTFNSKPKIMFLQPHIAIGSIPGNSYKKGILGNENTFDGYFVVDSKTTTISKAQYSPGNKSWRQKNGSGAKNRAHRIVVLVYLFF